MKSTFSWRKRPSQFGNIITINDCTWSASILNCAAESCEYRYKGTQCIPQKYPRNNSTLTKLKRAVILLEVYMNPCCFRHILILPFALWSRKRDSSDNATFLQYSSNRFPRSWTHKITRNIFSVLSKALLVVFRYKKQSFSKSVLLRVGICLMIQGIEFSSNLSFCCLYIVVGYMWYLLFTTIIHKQFLSRTVFIAWSLIYLICHSLHIRSAVRQEVPKISSFFKWHHLIFLTWRSTLAQNNLKLSSYVF